MRILRLVSAVVLVCVRLSCPTVGTAQVNDDLHKAVADGDISRVTALIDKGVDLNARDGTGQTPLMTAANNNRVEILRLLLQKGADVNEKVSGGTPAWMNGWTALMVAANHGNCGAVRVLLDGGANPKSTADVGSTVLMVALGCRDDIMGALQRVGADSDVKRDSGALMSAALTGDLNAVRTLLDKGTDVNAKWQGEGTALAVAAVAGHLDVVKLLLERGADVNGRTSEGHTTLMLTVENASDVEAIRRLVALNPRAKQDALGSTPQPTAAIVRALLDGGADVNAVTNEGGTALMYAVSAGDPEIVRTLTEKGARVNARNNRGQPALMIAIETALINMESDPAVVQRTASVVRVLVDHGADVNAAGNEGETALMYAAKECDEATVQILLSKGARVNAATNDGTSAMTIARASGCKKAVKQLRNAGAK